MMIRLAVLCMLFFVVSAFAANPSERERYATLIQEVRCVVCQNQSLAESSAPLAEDLRDKIQLMISLKKSDVEIKDYLVKRYGEFILLRPRFNKLTYFLWIFPFLGISCVIWFILRLRPANS